MDKNPANFIGNQYKLYSAESFSSKFLKILRHLAIVLMMSKSLCYHGVHF